MKKSGKLFVISGPSGAGKGTICKEILRKNNKKIELSVSMTTRKPRNGEQEGKNYYFTDIDKFEEKIKKGELLEHARVYDNYYGTPKQKVVDKLAEGIDVILEIDIQGALQVKKNFPDAILIFVLPPSYNVLRQRLIDRGTDEPQVIKNRLSKILDELDFVPKYDYCVINDDLENAVEGVENIIKGDNQENNKIKKEYLDIINSYKEELK